MKIYDWKKFLTFITIVLFLTIACLTQCSKKEREIKAIEEYEVQSGDTLWSICTKFKPHDMSIQEYIFSVRKLNNNTDCMIYPNEKIQVIIFGEEA